VSKDRPISEEDLHAYTDNALDVLRQADFEAYLQDHPEIARRVGSYAHQREMLRQAFDPISREPVPPELNLARMIAARRRSQSGRWHLAAAAVLLTAAGGSGGWVARGFTTQPNAGIAALAQEASVSYRVFGPDKARPVEVGADREQNLVEWISDRIRRPVSVPNLSEAGFQFIGGRLVATPHGPAGLLMYDDDQRSRIAILVRPMAVDHSAKMAEYLHGEITNLAWADEGTGYSLVGPLSSEQLHPIAAEIRRQFSTGL
jgi:anti-sigma factor RsiW